jgi:peptidoglycan/xylan/chitin deacetylase (PgdA/CDA1 family)
MKETHHSQLAILAYHKVGDPPEDGWPTWNYVSVETFGKHLEYLRQHQWEVLDIDTFLKGMAEPETLPEKGALITLDDGYLSNLQIALPILKTYNYPAVIFVPTNFVGGYNAFDADIFYEPKEPICSWEELLELDRNHVSVQSHGVTHSHFSELSEEEQIFEIVQSKELIESQIGKEVAIFSFPYGDNGGNVEKIKTLLGNAGYKAAVLYGGGPVDPASLSPFQLTRIAVGPDTSLNRELVKLGLESK